MVGGADPLTGGGGGDIFIYEITSDSTLALRDMIFDFNAADGDRIDLSNIDAITGGKNNDFTAVAAFTNVAGQLTITAQATPNLYLVQGDVNGDGVADFAIDVTSTSVLGAADFIL